MSMTLGWSIFAETRDSRRKRALAVDEVAAWACMNLIANARSVPAWAAFHTSPMPPIPRRTSRRYRSAII